MAWDGAGEGYRVAMQLGDPGSAAMGLGNAGAAALLSGASVDRAMVDLHQSSELARRASDIVIQVENLLRIGAVEAAPGNAGLANELLRSWRSLKHDYGLAVTEANKRIVNKYSTHPTSMSLPAQSRPPITLRAAVAFLGGGSEPESPSETDGQ